MSRCLPIFLVGFALLAGCAKEKPVNTTRVVDTPRGQYQWKETTYPAAKGVAAIVRDLSPSELAALHAFEEESHAFVKKYAHEWKEGEEILVGLDLAFAAWMRSEDPAKESSDQVIRIVGSALGFYCIEKLGVHWAIIEDEHGVDTALVRSDPEARSFPFSSIRYRVEDRKVDFIYALYLSLDHVIKEASRNGRTSGQSATPVDRPPSNQSLPPGVAHP